MFPLKQLAKVSRRLKQSCVLLQTSTTVPATRVRMAGRAKMVLTSTIALVHLDTLDLTVKQVSLSVTDPVFINY